MADAWYERVGDAVVGLFSPRAAAIRAHRRSMDRDADYRRAFELGCRLRGYKAAGSTGEGNATKWLDQSNRSADGEILPDLPVLRARVRSLVRNNPLARGIVRTLERGVVGTGLRPQARTGDDAKDNALEAVWAERRDRLALGDGALSHGRHQRLIYVKTIEDGEIFVAPAVDALTGELWFEAIEAERVCTPRDARPSDPMGRIVDGVEKDAAGRVVAYWILRRHPGDVLTGQTRLGAGVKATSSFSAKEFARVPADRCRHERADVLRPGQTRSPSRLATIGQDLLDLDLLILAMLKRTQMAACIAAFLTSDANTVDLIEVTAKEYGYQLDIDIEPGMVWRNFPGEKVEFLNPSQGALEIEPFVMLLARRCGRAVGLTAQTVLGAWDAISYSAARTIKIDDGQTFREDRSDFSACCSWEWRIVQEDALLRGDERLLAAGVTQDDLGLVEWVGDEERWVDPQADAEATRTMLALGLTTFQRECARLGHDWQENIRERVAAEVYEREARRTAGLPEAVVTPIAASPPKTVAA